MSVQLYPGARSILSIIVAGLVMMPIMLYTSRAAAQEVLPRPEPVFAGKIGLTYKDSEAVKPQAEDPGDVRHRGSARTS